MFHPRMIPIATILLLASTGAVAQKSQNSSHNPALKDSSPHQLAAPAHGANSFTSDQARGRLAKAGYTNVSKLTKDKAGIWRGTATKNGKSGPVGLDYKGNVVNH